MRMLPPLLVVLGTALSAADAVALPTTLDAGGHRATGDSSLQWAGGIGGIGVTELSSASYGGRSGWVGQLAEPATVEFGADRLVVARSDGAVSVPLLLTGGEEEPVDVPWSAEGAIMPASDDIAPAAGTAAIPAAGSGSFTVGILPRVDGMDSNLAFAFGTLPDDVEPGARTRTLLTIRADPRADGKTRPLIDSTPGLTAIDGDTWTYEVRVDVRGLILPHALHDDFDLVFALVDAPAGTTVVKTGPRTAQVVWNPAAGPGTHHRIRLLVRDAPTGLADIQDALVRVVARPASGG